jgi:6-phosphogluconolactonase (cycloisomerase 2 family)
MATLSSILGTGSFAPTSTALTAAATVDIDLTSDTFFTLTPDQNTTFTVSNVPAVSQFNLALTGFTTSSVTYDVGGAVYDSVSKSVTSQDTSPSDLVFKPDGTKMYMFGRLNSRVYQYTLGTAWDVSTATYDSISFLITSQDTAVYSVAFKSDGTKMFVLGTTNDRVYQYTLSTPWDVSTATYDTVSFLVSGQDTFPISVTFKPDGTKMYVLGYITDTVFQYTLSTAWDVSTATYDTVSFSVNAQDAVPYSVVFSTDGTKMFVLGTTNDTVFQYTLSTPWDVSTATYDTVSFLVSGQDTVPVAIAFKPDGTKMYMIGTNTKTVYQYTVGSIISATTTYPASFKFPAGTTPAAPLGGDTDLLDFQSFDGGVTWYGNQLGSDYL